MGPKATPLPSRRPPSSEERGSLGSIVELCGILLAPSWPLLGLSWASLRLPWAALGRLLVSLGILLDLPFRSPWDQEAARQQQIASRQCQKLPKRQKGSQNGPRKSYFLIFFSGSFLDPLRDFLPMGVLDASCPKVGISRGTFVKSAACPQVARKSGQKKTNIASKVVPKLERNLQKTVIKNGTRKSYGK